MINLFYESFPDSVTINGRKCPVVTDFREWIKFHDLLTDKEIPERAKLSLLPDWFIRPPLPLTDEHIKALLDFYLAKPLDPHADEEENEENSPSPPKPPVFDYRFDAPFLIADFQRFYRIDLMKIDFLHWFAFKALFQGLPEESSCQKRIYYRSADIKKIKSKAEKARIRKIQKAIALPFDMAEEAVGEELLALMKLEIQHESR